MLKSLQFHIVLPSHVAELWHFPTHVGSPRTQHPQSDLSHKPGAREAPPSRPWQGPSQGPLSSALHCSQGPGPFHAAQTKGRGRFFMQISCLSLPAWEGQCWDLRPGLGDRGLRKGGDTCHPAAHTPGGEGMSGVHSLRTKGERGALHLNQVHRV